MRRVYRKRSFGYLLPFLILVGIGVVGVLGFQVWSSWQGAKGDVYFYIASGKAKILPYGQTQWENAYNGTKLLVGDSLKTSTDGRLVLQFFNGTKVRLGEDSQLTLLDVNKTSDSEKIIVVLDHGKAWFNKMKSEEVESSLLEVHTAHMLVKDVGTIFEVAKDTTESVRVMKGSVKLDILANEDNKNPTVVASQDISIGQEVDVDEAILKALRDHKNPSLLLEIRNDFKNSDWYTWNSAEDRTPTDFAHSKSTNPSPNTNASSEELDSNFSTQETTSQSGQIESSDSLEDDVSTSSLEAPTILQPSSMESTTTENKMLISGKVSEGTSKVIVKQLLDGKVDEYTLGKFKPGDTTFSYNVSVLLGNLESGLNTYSFYAVDAKGNQSQPAKVSITYNKGTVVITDSLTAPVVKSFNGSSNSTVSSSTVKVVGEIRGAEKVVVNGYTLSKFEPGATTWEYFAMENKGNLKPGTNQYEVYGIDPNGKQSSRVPFTISYNKPEAVHTQQVQSSIETPANPSTATQQ